MALAMTLKARPYQLMEDICLYFAGNQPEGHMHYLQPQYWDVDNPEALELKKKLEKINEEHPGTYEIQTPPPEKERSTFMIRPLSAREMFELQAMEQRGITDAERQEFMLLHGLVGWENFRDETGKQIKFTDDPSALDYLMPHHRQEIAQQIDFASRFVPKN